MPPVGPGGPVGSAATVATVEKPLPGIVWSLATFAPPMARATMATTADVLRKSGDIRQRSLITTCGCPSRYLLHTPRAHSCYVDHDRQSALMST